MHRGLRTVTTAAAFVATVGVGLAPLPAQAATAQGSHLSFTQTVYRGTDGGAGCDHAAGYAEATPPAGVTYCYTVTNTGTTSLASVTLNDPAVGAPAVRSGDPKLVAPGATVRWYLETAARPDEADGKVDDTFVNVATVSATPSDAAGKPLAGAALVTAQASSQVYPPEVVPAPALGLAVSAYAGHDNGSHCPGKDGASLTPGDALTWCYVVTNTGNTRLAGVTFTDLGVAGEPTLVSGTLPLAPGASGLWYLDATVPAGAGAVEARPAARATSVDDGGRELAGVTMASASVGASLQVAATTVSTSTTATPAPNLIIEDPSLSTPSTTAPTPTTQAGTATTAMAKGGARASQSAAQHPAAKETTTSAKPQLAYTGWETWLIFVLGIGLVALGWLLTDAARRRSAEALAATVAADQAQL